MNISFPSRSICRHALRDCCHDSRCHGDCCYSDSDLTISLFTGHTEDVEEYWARLRRLNWKRLVMKEREDVCCDSLDFVSFLYSFYHMSVKTIQEIFQDPAYCIVD